MAQPTRLGFVGGGGGWRLELGGLRGIGKGAALLLMERGYGAAYSPGIRGRRWWVEIGAWWPAWHWES